MIMRGTAVTRRLAREIERHAGSMARVIFYDGAMPEIAEAVADGVRISAIDMPEGFGLAILYGDEPKLPEGARYWRLLSNEGEVVMQGNSQ